VDIVYILHNHAVVDYPMRSHAMCTEKVSIALQVVKTRRSKVREVRDDARLANCFTILDPTRRPTLLLRPWKML
jgi:hypothetical protein